MKKLIFTFIAMLSIAAAAAAKAPETLTLRKGQQKTASSSKISVKFISVLDDSRCPSNAKCIWAGNARIQIAVSKGKKTPQIFELNSNLKPQSIVFEGYEINFGSLTPHPGQDTVSLPAPVATITIAKAGK